jgi:hypothetical protein
MSADGARSTRAIEHIDDALKAEARAHSALVAIGEQWVLFQESGCEPTEEERALHAHLVRQWRHASKVLAELLERPLRHSQNSTAAALKTTAGP